MTALHDTGDLTCPRRGASLADVEGDKPPTGDLNHGLRTPITCPACAAPLELVVESALPEALGVDMYVEDRNNSKTETSFPRRLRFAYLPSPFA